MSGYIQFYERLTMNKNRLRILYLGIITLISVLFIYPTQTAYVPLTKDHQTSVNAESTPVLDPAYVLRNPNWDIVSHQLKVNVTALPLPVQKQLQQNTKKLGYPLKYTHGQDAMKVIIQTPNAPDAHGLTTNGGNTVLLEKSYLTTNQKDPQKIARTMTHELGHVLGLLHTSHATIMYPYNISAQPLYLNASQRAYIHHLTKTTYMTRLAYRLVTPVWQAKAVNQYVATTQLGQNNLNIYASKHLLPPAALSSLVVIANLLPILVIAEIIYDAYLYKKLYSYTVKEKNTKNA